MEMSLETFWFVDHVLTATRKPSNSLPRAKRIASAKMVSFQLGINAKVKIVVFTYSFINMPTLNSNYFFQL